MTTTRRIEATTNRYGALYFCLGFALKQQHHHGEHHSNDNDKANQSDNERVWGAAIEYELSSNGIVFENRRAIHFVTGIAYKLGDEESTAIRSTTTMMKCVCLRLHCLSRIQPCKAMPGALAEGQELPSFPPCSAVLVLELGHRSVIAMAIVAH